MRNDTQTRLTNVANLADALKDDSKNMTAVEIMKVLVLLFRVKRKNARLKSARIKAIQIELSYDKLLEDGADMLWDIYIDSLRRSGDSRESQGL